MLILLIKIQDHKDLTSLIFYLYAKWEFLESIDSRNKNIKISHDSLAYFPLHTQ